VRGNIRQKWGKEGIGWKKHTHAHTRLMALCPGLPLKQKLDKSALRSRQIAMPAPHHSVFYRPDALPAAQPTASKH